MTSGGYDAVLLASFGGPEGPDDVMPFLRRVTAGRGVPDERLADVAGHYLHFGGVSPINRQNRELKAALQQALDAADLDLPVYWGNRNSAPFFTDALRDAHAAGHDRLLALVTSAYTSYSGVGQYRENLVDALTETGLSDVMSIDRLREFFDHPGFVEPFIAGVRDAAAALPGAHLVFVTHSIPTAAADSSGPEYGPGGAYVAQHRAVAAHIAAQAAPGSPFTLAFQSRSGSPATPWLEPDVNDELRRLAASGVHDVILVPIGFVSDHVEVLWDLDNEAAQTAAELGMHMRRVATPGTQPAFVAGLVNLIRERVDAVPTASRAHVTALGPWPDRPTIGAPRAAVIA